MTAVLTDTEREQDKNSHQARVVILQEMFKYPELTKNTLKLLQLVEAYPRP